MIDLVETVKFVGGLGGLASSAFLIYDRLLRDQPLAFLAPIEYKTGISFLNTTRETIIINRVAVSPPMLELARADDSKTVNQERAETWYGRKSDELERIFILLKPGEQRTFALHRFPDFENAPDAQSISIRCGWKHTRSIFRFPRNVGLRTTAKELRDIRDAALANKA